MAAHRASVVAILSFSQIQPPLRQADPGGQVLVASHHLRVAARKDVRGLVWPYRGRAPRCILRLVVSERCIGSAVFAGGRLQSG